MDAIRIIMDLVGKDPRLTIQERGVMLTILTQKDPWLTSSAHLSFILGKGLKERTFAAVARKLVNLGYLVRVHTDGIGETHVAYKLNLAAMISRQDVPVEQAVKSYREFENWKPKKIDYRDVPDNLDDMDDEDYEENEKKLDKKLTELKLLREGDWDFEDENDIRTQNLK